MEERGAEAARVQVEVSKAVQQMGVPCVWRQMPSREFVGVMRGAKQGVGGTRERIALCIDGGWHRAKGAGGMMARADVRNRVLQRGGCRVCSVWVEEWAACRDDRERQDLILRLVSGAEEVA